MEKYVLASKSQSNELCSATMVRRVAAMLDLETANFQEGGILPKGWHFFMLAGETRKSDLRQDGFPGLGIPLPDFGLPRLLLGGRTVSYNSDIIIGATMQKTSCIKSISEKNGTSGKMAIVTIQHELRAILEEKPAIVETQTYILKEELEINQLGIKKQDIKQEDSPEFLISNSKFLIKIPDETLLFQYSALGFNSHKIHLDRNYAQNVEGLPDLVVNGGLTTLLVTEFVKNNLALEITDIKIKHLAPLYCNKLLTITAEKTECGWLLHVYDNNNIKAVEAALK
jgi:3-methylfumaryl-CoA hydratase